jgi:hypothetical protein
MRQQGSGGVAKTAYQRWKEAGRPRPYANEMIAVERFDFFALASLLLAVALLGWWIHSIYTVAFPSQKGIPVTYSRGGGSIFGVTPTPTPMPTPGQWARRGLPRGGTGRGGPSGGDPSGGVPGARVGLDGHRCGELHGTGGRRGGSGRGVADGAVC